VKTQPPPTGLATTGLPEIPRKYGPVADWCVMTGMSRRVTYDRLARGELRAIKVGTRTLLDFEHGLAWLRALPSAQFTLRRRVPRQEIEAA
jgi:hypothetical protein